MSCQSVPTALLFGLHNKMLCLNLQESLCLEGKHWSQNQESLERNERFQTFFTQNSLLRTSYFWPPRMIFIFTYLFLSTFVGCEVHMYSCGSLHVWRPQVDMGNLSQCFSILFFEIGAPTEPGPHRLSQTEEKAPLICLHPSLESQGCKCYHAQL